MIEFYRHGFRPRFIGTDAWGTYSTVIKNLVADSSQTATAPTIYDPQFKSPLNDFFVHSFRKIYQRSPTDLAALSFDAVRIFSSIDKFCGVELQSDQIVTCLKKFTPLKGTVGSFSLRDETLSLNRSIRMRDVRLGRNREDR